MSADKLEGGTEVRPDARANEKPVPALDAANVAPSSVCIFRVGGEFREP